MRKRWKTLTRSRRRLNHRYYEVRRAPSIEALLSENKGTLDAFDRESSNVQATGNSGDAIPPGMAGHDGDGTEMTDISPRSSRPSRTGMSPMHCCEQHEV